ncbi:MAG: binding-protein-dependent transport system inner rane component [Microbacteriaceae bacterium]|jgi:ABC-type sugar transport system permease subunit|nr:binding-protein-dependent transport system inner rane component [Microbacteriaceae bacterium]
MATAISHPRPRRPNSRARTGWFFLAPSIILIAVFVIYPIVQSLWMSLHDWSFFQAQHPFVGISNYVEMLRDPRFWNALSNTVVFTVATVPAQIALGLLLAVRLRRSSWWTLFLRSVFFFPVISSFATMAIVWKFMLSANVGPSAAWLRGLGVSPVDWLHNPDWALTAVIVVGLWKNIGFTMVILLAALQDVPETLVEAAVLDGAGPWRRFISVALPSIRQALLFSSVIAVIGSLQVFDQVYVMTQGGPQFRSETLVTYIYQQGFTEFRSGYASAIAWGLFLIIMIVSVLQLRIFRYRDVD